MKRISVLFLSLMLVITGCVGSTTPVRAEESATEVKYEDITSENESRIQNDFATYGVYLYMGDAVIAEAGSGKIAAGGSTSARKTVTKITVGVRVQRKVDGLWYNYTTWSKSLNNASYVSTSKELTVPKGYYYRVLTTHTAQTDSSTSSTSGIWID